MGAGDSNSSPDACAASTLPPTPEAFLHPKIDFSETESHTIVQDGLKLTNIVQAGLELVPIFLPQLRVLLLSRSICLGHRWSICVLRVGNLKTSKTLDLIQKQTA